MEQLEEAPDVLAIPVGNAGNITAYWKGFKEYHEKKEVNFLNYLVSKQKEPHQLFKIKLLKILKQSLQQSVSVIQQVGKSNCCVRRIEWPH